MLLRFFPLRTTLPPATPLMALFLTSWANAGLWRVRFFPDSGENLFVPSYALSLCYYVYELSKPTISAEDYPERFANSAYCAVAHHVSALAINFMTFESPTQDWVVISFVGVIWTRIRTLNFFVYEPSGVTVSDKWMA